MLIYPVGELALGKVEAFPKKLSLVFSVDFCVTVSLMHIGKLNDCSIFLRKIEHSRLSAKSYVGEVL
jgi:hypothetical protein